MAKTLRVIDPFFVMDLGDTFEYNEDTKMYVSTHKDEFYKIDDEGDVNEIKSSYNSEFQISVDYAKGLIEDGYLEEVEETKKDKFVNIFEEIEKLLNKYKKELSTINNNTVEIPACLRVERETVLTNLITLLEHLKGLKK